MRLGRTWTGFCQRLRLYVASGAFSLAYFVFWLARRVYRGRLLILADVRYALRLGERLSQLGWGLTVAIAVTNPRRVGNGSRMPRRLLMAAIAPVNIAILACAVIGDIGTAGIGACHSPIDEMLLMQ